MAELLRSDPAAPPATARVALPTRMLVPARGAGMKSGWCGFVRIDSGAGGSKGGGSFRTRREPHLGDLPVLWVHGADDTLVALADTRDGVKAVGATRLVERIYPRARHELCNELNADEVLAEVTAFVTRVTA